LNAEPWQKVLWKRQPYPDSYTDASFLQHLVRELPRHAASRTAGGRVLLLQLLTPGCRALVHPATLRQVVNADVPERDFWTVVLGSTAVTQQVSTVVAAVSVPVHLRLGLIAARSLLLANMCLLLTGAVGGGLFGCGRCVARRCMPAGDGVGCWCPPAHLCHTVHRQAMSCVACWGSTCWGDPW
jgi:hypothetical protein